MLSRSLQLEETPGTTQNENGTAYAPKPLLPFGKRLPAKRVVHLPNITADPVKLQLLVGPPTPDAKVWTAMRSRLPSQLRCGVCMD